jgi:hypothetical protein
VNKELLAQTGKPYFAAKEVAVNVELVRLPEQRDHFARKLPASKWPAPAEHPFERRGRGLRPTVDPTMRGGSYGCEAIIAGEQRSPESQQRRILHFHGRDSAAPFPRLG